MACDEVSGRGSQKDNRTQHILDLSEPAKQDIAHHVFVEFLVLKHGGGERRPRKVGATPLTLTPCGAHSMARALVNCTTPPLLEQ